MFVRKCSLCGGKLDTHRVCKECGLDNTKSEKYYKVNRSSCDDMPLTHVHEEEPPRTERIKKSGAKGRLRGETKKYTHQKKQKNDKSKVISIMTSVIVLIMSVTGLIGSLVDTFFSETSVSQETIDPYEDLGNEHPAEGESCSFELESGMYIVGLHIPEGDYWASVNSNYDVIEVMDDENGIYLYEYIAKDDENFLGDLRLFKGAIVTVSTEGTVVLNTDNAQMDTKEEIIENPAKESYFIQEGMEWIAGEEFEAGIYDVYATGEVADVHIMVYGPTGNEIYYAGYDIGEDGSYGTCFRNLVIPEDAHIECENGDIELVPSALKGNENYLEYYY